MINPIVIIYKILSTNIKKNIRKNINRNEITTKRAKSFQNY